MNLGLGLNIRSGTLASERRLRALLDGSLPFPILCKYLQRVVEGGISTDSPGYSSRSSFLTRYRRRVTVPVDSFVSRAMTDASASITREFARPNGSYVRN